MFGTVQWVDPCYIGECATGGVHCDGVRCTRAYFALARAKPGQNNPPETTAYAARLPIADDARLWFDGLAGDKSD